MDRLVTKFSSGEIAAAFLSPTKQKAEDMAVLDRSWPCIFCNVAERLSETQKDLIMNTPEERIAAIEQKQRELADELKEAREAIEKAKEPEWKVGDCFISGYGEARMICRVDDNKFHSVGNDGELHPATAQTSVDELLDLYGPTKRITLQEWAASREDS